MVRQMKAADPARSLSPRPKAGAEAKPTEHQAHRQIITSLLRNVTGSSEHSNSVERTRDRFRETEQLFHGRQPGAATHRLGRACPAHCYHVEDPEKSLSPPKSHKGKTPGAQYTFNKAQREVAGRFLVSRNGMAMSPRDLEKYHRPGPGHYETVHAADSGDAFPTKLSTLPSARSKVGMKVGPTARTGGPVSKLSTKFGKAPRTINFAALRPDHVVLDAQLVTDFPTGLELQPCV